MFVPVVKGRSLRTTSLQAVLVDKVLILDTSNIYSLSKFELMHQLLTSLLNLPQINLTKHNQLLSKMFELHFSLVWNRSWNLMEEMMTAFVGSTRAVVVHGAKHGFPSSLTQQKRWKCTATDWSILGILVLFFKCFYIHSKFFPIPYYFNLHTLTRTH